MAAPRLFLSHQTACAYWIHGDLAKTKATRCVPAKSDVIDVAQIEDARYLITGLDEKVPLHAAVFSKGQLRKVSPYLLHARNVPYPDWSFRRITGDVFVASPELCFLHAAAILPFEALLLYGLELCGTYARTEDPNYPCYKRTPLSSAAKIKAYLDKSIGAHGVKQAQKACTYLIDGSASVRESALALLMTLPPRYGGFGLPKPQLNYGIEVNAPDKVHPGCNLVLHGDIVWPQAKLVVEYDGSQHGLENNHASDKQRDHLLLDAGYEVVRITDAQIRNAAELQRLACTINKRAGLRRPSASLQTDSKKLELQRKLLFECDPQWLGAPAENAL